MAARLLDSGDPACCDASGSVAVAVDGSVDGDVGVDVRDVPGDSAKLW
jgi:hypothetical protein